MDHTLQRTLTAGADCSLERVCPHWAQAQAGKADATSHETEKFPTSKGKEGRGGPAGAASSCNLQARERVG